jgi:hypothetical protein
MSDNDAKTKFSFLESPRFPRLKDVSIFLGWICVLILIGGLCWSLSAPLRARLLMKSVNRVLTLSGDPRRLDSPVPLSALKPGSARIGTWYTLSAEEDEGRALIFILIAEGTFFPCAAETDPRGRVVEIIPLSRHGEKMFKRLSPGIIQVYIRRIEGTEGGSSS